MTSNRTHVQEPDYGAINKENLVDWIEGVKNDPDGQNLFTSDIPIDEFIIGYLAAVSDLTSAFGLTEDIDQQLYTNMDNTVRSFMLEKTLSTLFGDFLP